MKKVLVVEDNINSRNMITNVLSQIDPSLKIYETGSAEEAYYIAICQSIQLFIVDIILNKDVPGDVSGIVFADRLRKCKQYKHVPIVIITALEDPKLNAYSHLHCCSYLEKPIDIEGMKSVLKEALEIPVVKEKNEYVYFRKDGILYSVCMKDIIFITVEGRHNRIVCKEEIIETGYISCKQLLELLDSDDFVQCNRSTIVNRQYIKTIDTTNRYITLKGTDIILEIGIIMKKGFLQKINIENDCD